MNRGENSCRSILEGIYNREFKTARPPWLVNPRTGRRLEFDCFNEELGIALDYNGKQHYPNNANLRANNIIVLDQLKRTKCEEQGVKLIIVPYDILFSDHYSFITGELEENKYCN